MKSWKLFILLIVGSFYVFQVNDQLIKTLRFDEDFHAG